MGVKPKIHYQKGYPCEEIAGLFEKKILQYIANYQPVVKEKGQLLLVDRTIDPIIPLIHSTSYQVYGMILCVMNSRW